MNKLAELRDLLATGKFHHATYRSIGTCWEGLHIYQRDENGYNGFTPAGLLFGKGDPELEAALQLVAHTGYSVGAYGQG